MPAAVAGTMPNRMHAALRPHAPQLGCIPAPQGLFLGPIADPPQACGLLPGALWPQGLLAALPPPPSQGHTGVLALAGLHAPGLDG